MGKKLFLSPFYHNRPNFLRICISKDFYWRRRTSYGAKLQPSDITISKDTSEEAKNKDLPLTPSALSSYDVAARCHLCHGQDLFYGRGGYQRVVPIVQAIPKPTDFAIGVELEMVFNQPSQGADFIDETQFSGRHDILVTRDAKLYRSLNELGGYHKYMAYCMKKSSPDSSYEDPQFLDLYAKALQKRCPKGLLSNWFYFKRDGSLPPASAELVTIPLPSKIALNPKTWDGLCEYLSPVFHARSNSSCGLHVHVNLGYFYPEWAINLMEKDHSFAVTYRYIVRLFSCRLYAALLQHNSLLLFQVFKRSSGPYCIPISTKQFNGVPGPNLTIALNNFFRWLKINTSRNRRHLPIYNSIPHNARVLPANKNGTNLITTLLRNNVPYSILDDLFQSSDKLQETYDTSSLSLPFAIQKILRMTRAERESNPNIRDLYDHHSILGLTDTTLEFRQGKGTLNPLEIRTIISFIYAFCSFVKRVILSNSPLDMLTKDYKELTQDFVKFTSHHATEPYLRHLCHLFLATPSERGTAMIQYPQETTDGHSYCCDTRGE